LRFSRTAPRFSQSSLKRKAWRAKANDVARFHVALSIPVPAHPGTNHQLFFERGVDELPAGDLSFRLSPRPFPDRLEGKDTRQVGHHEFCGAYSDEVGR
jgi:hypothetical protein